MTLSPQKIKLDKKERVIVIGWNDLHETAIGFSLLRVACPCATCRGGQENMKAEPDLCVLNTNLPETNMTTVDKIDMVGSYAISVLWGDGHHYGIYTWNYLRALCTCEECNANR